MATDAVEPDLHILRNRSVLGIGLGSLLSDTGHEMATAALPGFLASIGTQAAALGAIEGIADASMSASKVVGGILADRPGVERKAVTAGGYAITAVGHGFSARPILAVRRGRPRPVLGRSRRQSSHTDSLLAGSVPPHQLGRAFGVERSMDSLGAIIGPLLAAPLIIAVGYRWLFAISALPGLLAALAVLVLVREAPRIVDTAHHINLSIRGLASKPAPTGGFSSASDSTDSATSRRPCSSCEPPTCSTTAEDPPQTPPPSRCCSTPHTTQPTACSRTRLVLPQTDSDAFASSSSASGSSPWQASDSSPTHATSSYLRCSSCLLAHRPRSSKPGKARTRQSCSRLDSRTRFRSPRTG